MNSLIWYAALKKVHLLPGVIWCCDVCLQAADNAALEIIMGVASDREANYKPAPLPGPPPGPPASAGGAAAPKNAAEFFSTLDTSAPVSSSRERGGGEDREVSAGVIGGTPYAHLWVDTHQV